MILKIGSRGKQVIELQTLLGIKNPDGIFGKITNQKVVEFQKNNNLNPDGLVGPKTWAKLLESKENKITPIYNVDTKEDFSDPEEEMLVSSDKENTPTSNYVYELINLIQKSNITRSINRVIFHCTATQPNATVTSIQKYWKESLKWDSPGYHIIVKANGSWTQLQDFNRPTNGVRGHNSRSIHISYIGGIDSKGKAFDSRTPEQLVILEDIYILLKDKLKGVSFHGHYEFSNKACPSFNVKNWIDSIEKKYEIL
jgi:N-acetylmuramoyl-L-alanine amidase